MWDELASLVVLLLLCIISDSDAGSGGSGGGCGSGGEEVITTAWAPVLGGAGLTVAGGTELKYPSVGVLSGPHDGQERVAV